MSRSNQIVQTASIVSSWTNSSSGVYLLRSYAASTATLVAAGTGYTVGDTLTLVGGTATTATIVTVATITGGGGTGPVGTVTITTAGRYTVPPTGTLAVTGGTGSNATFTATYAYANMSHATAPTGLSECFVTSQPFPVETFGLFVRNTFTRASGTGAWSFGGSTASKIVAKAAPSVDLLCWPGAADVTVNTGGPVISMGTNTPVTHVALLNKHCIGDAAVSTGDIYGSYIGLQAQFYDPRFKPLQAAAWWIYIKPNAVAADTNAVWNLTTDIFEVYGY